MKPLYTHITLFSWKITISLTKHSQLLITYLLNLASPISNQASLFSTGSQILACLQVWAWTKALGYRLFPLNSSFWRQANNKKKNFLLKCPDFATFSPYELALLITESLLAPFPLLYLREAFSSLWLWNVCRFQG